MYTYSQSKRIFFIKEENKMFCNSCGTEVSEATEVCPNCGNSTVKIETKEVLGCKWANFLGYFYFWLCCVIELFAIIELLELSGNSALIAFITFSIILGIVSVFILAVAAMAIINRKRNARNLVCLVFCYEFVMNIVILIYGSAILGVSTFSVDDSIRMILELILVFANASYFDNRSDIFIN